MNRHAAIVLLASLSLVGCYTHGSFLEPEEVDDLKRSVTTARQLEEALGPPSVVIPGEDGNPVWVYDGIYSRAGATSYIPYVNLVAGRNVQRCTRLAVVVDRNDGTLRDWQYRSQDDTDFWAKADDNCNPDKTTDKARTDQPPGSVTPAAAP